MEEELNIIVNEENLEELEELYGEIPEEMEEVELWNWQKEHLKEMIIL